MNNECETINTISVFAQKYIAGNLTRIVAHMSLPKKKKTRNTFNFSSAHEHLITSHLKIPETPTIDQREPGPLANQRPAAAAAHYTSYE